MTTKTDNTIRVFFIRPFTNEEADRLNDPETGGWDSEPRFARYASLTCNAPTTVVESAWLHGEYELAAVVKTDSLDWAYHQTQNITEAWPTNDDVERITAKPRSSMVGDVFEKDGEFFVCAPVGFEKIDISEPMLGGALMQCHDCDDRLEEDEMVVVDAGDEVEPAGFIYCCPSCANERERKAEQPFHFYATCVFGWATSTESVEDAITRLAQRFRPDVQRIIRGEKKNGNDGMYFWSCRVLAPSDAPYKIEWFAPVGVECVDAQEWNVTRCTLKAVEFVPVTNNEGATS